MGIIKSLSIFRFDLRLSPASAIKHLNSDSGEYEWESTDTDPQFSVKLRFPMRGWFMLEVALQHNQPSVVTKLYLDCGKGFSEEHVYSLPIKNGRVSKRLVFLPFGVKKIRLDPLESEGEFNIRHARLIWLTSAFAEERLLHRLINMHYRFREQDLKCVRREIKASAKEKGCPVRDHALQLYNQTFIKRPTRRGYQDWIECEEQNHHQQFALLSQQSQSGPLISILLPVYNTPEIFLRECLDSVITQRYQNWQLCIADDGSDKSHVRQVLDSYAAKDNRITVCYREENGHISAASNSALELVTGRYIALLDHDDCLSEFALSRVVDALNKNSAARLLYSDEDKIDADGFRFDPHFKPEWNYDLLLAQNYIAHLSVLDTDLVRGVGGFKTGVEGSQDHDLLLRCIAHLSPDEIVHIPHILYHWRSIEGSTASAANEKDYTSEAGLKAVSEYCRQYHPGASAEPGIVPNTYKVCWPVPEPAPLVSLLIPTRDNVEVLRCCVDAILQLTDYKSFEIIILNNQSSCEETLEYLERITTDPRVTVVNWDYPFNYSSINNFGVTKARGSVIGLLNNDIEPINPGWLTEMVSLVCRSDVGCVGAKLYYPNETIQHAGVILGIGGVAGHSHKYYERHEHGYFSRLRLVQELSAVTGACLLIRRSVYEEVGGLNEANLAVAFNDVDLCLKVRAAGYKNIWTPYAELYHHESVSRGADDSAKKRKRAKREAEYMRKQWGEQLYQDPAYNPNLTLVHEDFSLR
ncbi:glycosyltransferase family 2 protein [Amphritea atlantica]|nr:glycosyltransferase family 2 protein [Amphritea atlantica]